MKREIHTDVYLDDPDPNDRRVARVFLYMPHRVYLSKQDMLNGPLKPKRWRWMWLEHVFEYIHHSDITLYKYFLDERLEAKTQKAIEKRRKMKQISNMVTAE